MTAMDLVDEEAYRLTRQRVRFAQHIHMMHSAERGRVVTRAKITLAIGLMMVAMSASALAGDPSDHIGWRELGLGAVGLLVSIVSAYVAGQAKRISALEMDVRLLREKLLSDYHPSLRIDSLMAGIVSKLDAMLAAEKETAVRVGALHARLDNHGVGRANQ